MYEEELEWEHIWLIWGILKNNSYITPCKSSRGIAFYSLHREVQQERGQREFVQKKENKSQSKQEEHLGGKCEQMRKDGSIPRSTSRRACGPKGGQTSPSLEGCPDPHEGYTHRFGDHTQISAMLPMSVLSAHVVRGPKM